MTESEIQMARLMAHKSRHSFLKRVAQLIPKDASMILDIGCGVGTIRPLILDWFPVVSIVGLDFSWHMLTHQVEKASKTKTSLVQAAAPSIPFSESKFDAVIAVQFMSEVLCFCGEDGLMTTLNETKRLLRPGGVLVVLDHQKPHEQHVDLRLSESMRVSLEYFQTHFQVRKVEFEEIGNDWVRIPLRDVYDFLTKVWSFGTPLEGEEMHESHTPYTGEEFANLLKNCGYTINSVDSVIDFANYLRRHRVRIREKVDLPSRYFLVSASPSV